MKTLPNHKADEVDVRLPGSRSKKGANKSSNFSSRHETLHNEGKRHPWVYVAGGGAEINKPRSEGEQVYDIGYEVAEHVTREPMTSPADALTS